jgi:hypothetical protein
MKKRSINLVCEIMKGETSGRNQKTFVGADISQTLFDRCAYWLDTVGGRDLFWFVLHFDKHLSLQYYACRFPSQIEE